MIIVSQSPKEIKISGHANYAPKGQDIVCAAVSALVTTTVNSLDSFKKNQIKVKTDGQVTLLLNSQISKNDQSCLKLLMNGLKLISKQYPKYVKIRRK